VAKDKEFRGKDALLKHHPTKRLVTIILENPRAIVLSNEPVRVEGKILGRVTSGAYGAHINASIAFAYLPVEHSLIDMNVDILVFGNWIKGKIAKGPLYDPGGKKVRT
jgi:glycine cleavage system aminomethyltransferase T